MNRKLRQVFLKERLTLFEISTKQRFAIDGPKLAYNTF